MQKVENGEEVTVDTQKWSYEEICSQELSLIPACDTYQRNDNGLFEKTGNTDSEIEALLGQAVRLKITGIIRPAKDTDNALISKAVGYTGAAFSQTDPASASAGSYDDNMTAFGYVSMDAPSGSALLLIALSVLLTLIGGRIPSRKAAKKDPVAALRSE